MKKKVVAGIFSLVIIITVIAFLAGAIESYKYDMENGVDILEGFGAVLAVVVGGFVVFYELDLFYIVWYFFFKPKTTAKSLLNIFANLTLMLAFFSDHIAKFLYRYISDVFGEEAILTIALFLIYIVLRIACAVVSSE